MSPIKDLSESTRLPRLGKIHLGIKKTKLNEKGEPMLDSKTGLPIEFPLKTEYFVLPKDHSDYTHLVNLYGERPKELRILIPVEDEELWASQYYKAYDRTHGLICKGDGEIAMRMIDTKTGALPAKNTDTIALKEMTCAGKECPDYKAKKCHESMNFRFILPEAPGLGVWQIDTGSINSILNINSCGRMIKKAFGRISLIPLKLTLEPIEVNNPETGKKQTVYVMNLRASITLAQLADVAREQVKMLALPEPDLDAEFVANVQEDIDTLWGERTEANKAVVVDTSPPDAQDAPKSLKKPVKAPTKDKAPEGEKPPVADELSWPVVWGQIAKLYDERKEGWTLQSSVIKKLTDIGATENSGIKIAYASLSTDGKRKFIELIKKES